MTGTIELSDQDVKDLVLAIEFYSEYRNLHMRRTDGGRSRLARLERLKDLLLKVEVNSHD